MGYILITGANGFIGRALATRMLAEEWQVRGTVRSTKHLSSLLDGIDISRVESIGSDTDWSKALNGVDTVVHLAARVHVVNDVASDSLAAFRWVNVKGTERLAQQAAATGCRRFIFMSSIQVNGEGMGDNPQITQITRIRKKRTEVAPVEFPWGNPYSTG